MLQFEVLKHEHQNIALYNKAFKLWQNVWTEFYGKNEGRPEVHSDPFLFNDDICIITFEQEPIAVFLMSYFNKNLHARLESSYLHQYPDGVIHKAIAGSEISEVCHYSNITVHPEFRRQNKQMAVSINWLQFSFAMHCFAQRGSDILFGYCRNEKGMNDMAIAHGAEVLAQGVRHKCAVDFISIDKSRAKISPRPEVKAEADRLWFEYLQRNSGVSRAA